MIIAVYRARQATKQQQQQKGNWGVYANSVDLNRTPRDTASDMCMLCYVLAF